MKDTTMSDVEAGTDTTMSNRSGVISATLDETTGAYRVDDAFWDLGVIAGHERFDVIALAGGSLLIRACPYTEAELREVRDGVFHGDDPEFTASDASHCGLTKWMCAGCGVGSIVETEDDFPAGWIEVSQLDGRGDTTAFEAVCQLACLAKLAERDSLRGMRMPGFSPESYRGGSESTEDGTAES